VLAIIQISITMQRQATLGARITLAEGPGVGVVRVYGRIESTGDMLSQANADYVVKRLDELAQDSRIKAIVVRINSPGGTVAATQEIYNKILSLKKKNIPIVASMGDLAASGGYYIASACNAIVANYGTITGSIGVIAIAPNLRGLFEKLGIRMNVIKSGKYKDILASYRELSPEELQLIQQIIDTSYKKFVHDVAVGRNMAESDIMPYADGRVFTGSQAVEYKLVDELGTFEDAVNKARQLAKLPEDSAVYEDTASPIERILTTMSSFVKPKLEQYIPTNYSLVEYSYMP
jgi:protease-4